MRRCSRCCLKNLWETKGADEIINKIEKQYSFSSDKLYTRACVYTLTGKLKLALDYLRKHQRWGKKIQSNV
ncbi:hypothetical protein Ccel_0059 [Ruminiclostridium cellulolyticum H10]|uniref:Uncharacterized protein n=1 Tax=Ruminiclostridium cellulolyticum (strain ATCC 35319 / DSM 5812 / JCM 6584 / H10) TaxID=394503 RepID=B8I3X0_RUMCH|nr:hypothetical protein Ccel_0059 [Ruminiclostridium cellulolyticum H10]